MRARVWAAGIAAAVVVPAHAAAATAPVVTAPALTTPEMLVAGDPGNQRDASVNGNLVSYSHESSFVDSEIRYFDITTTATAAVPTTAWDFQPDVVAGRVVFTRLEPLKASIQVFGLAAQTVTEVDPVPGSDRWDPSLGGDTVGWMDYGFYPNPLHPHAEVVVHDLATGVTTRLTNDLVADLLPNVSPSGDVVVWASCEFTVGVCEAREAARTATGWSIAARATAADAWTVTDGALVVYTVKTSPSDGTDVAWQPVGGGDEVRLALASDQQRVSVSDGVIVFDANDSGNYNIYAYDTRTALLYAVATTPFEETYADVAVSGDTATVVFTRFNGLDDDVVARQFALNRGAPADDLGDLRTEVETSASKLTKALVAKLEAAQDALAAGDVSAACQALQDFINHVNAQRGKKIDVAQADAWVASATAVRSALGCA